MRTHWLGCHQMTSATEQRVQALVAASHRLCHGVSRLQFGAPVSHVYNPLSYARQPHECYLRKYGARTGRTLLLGMNPGPFGMAQTGVPFGEVALVRDWLKVEGLVERPALEHPARPVLGFACARSEVSGARLWGWAKARYSTPRKFFQQFFVVNYCPLVFMDQSGKNRTPDKLPPHERQALFAVCDEALAEVVQCLRPRAVVGVGAFAKGRAALALAGTNTPVAQILHPSPANPKANAGWAQIVESQLADLELIGN